MQLDKELVGEVRLCQTELSHVWGSIISQLYNIAQFESASLRK